MKKKLRTYASVQEAQTVHIVRDTNIWLKMGYERVF